MLKFNKKTRLADLSQRYKSLMDQATNYKSKGELRMSYRLQDEADIIAAVIHRIKSTAF